MGQIRVLLVGGPSDLTGTKRMPEVPSLADSVKVPRGAGYEHFRYSGRSTDLDGVLLPVFEWCDRTRIAE